MLLALELIAGRRQVWLPRRWRERDLGPTAQRRFRELLVKRIRGSRAAPARVSARCCRTASAEWSTVSSSLVFP